MRQIFITYANEDKKFADLVEANLKDAGYRVWLDSNRLRLGEEWRKAIDEGISTSDVLLIVVTPQSGSSEYVTYEWAFALGKGIKVIPLLLEKAKMHPRLEILQHLDYTEKNDHGRSYSGK